MLRAYHDKDDLTKDSGVEYKGKIYNDNNLVNKAYVDATDDLQTAAINELQGSVLVLQQEIEQLSQLQDTGKWVYNGNGATYELLHGKDNLLCQQLKASLLRRGEML